jgi:hypothetical protein
MSDLLMQQKNDARAETKRGDHRVPGALRHR